MGHKYTTLFPFVKPHSQKNFDFSKIASLGSELTELSRKDDETVSCCRNNPGSTTRLPA